MDRPVKRWGGVPRGTGELARDVDGLGEGPDADERASVCEERRDMTRRALTWLVAWLGPLALRAWFATIRFRWCGGVYLHPDPRPRGNCIYVFWHQRLLCFTYTHSNRGVRVLISRSREGEVIARVAGRLGHVPIRGSSRRGPIAAVRGLLAEAGRGYDFGLTPDGPLGPRHVFKMGAVYLASQSGLPVVPVTVSYGRCWRRKSWDEFLVPWPFTWGVIHVGPPVAVPPDLDAAGLETWRLRLEETLRLHTRTTDEQARKLYLTGRPLCDLCVCNPGGAAHRGHGGGC